MVRTSTPASAQAIVIGRTFSVPAWWPARRGMPRPFAQRPLPSMMMPTWVGTASGRGTAVGWGFGAPATSVIGSDLRHFRLLPPGDLLDALDELIGQLLQSLLGALFVLHRDAAAVLFLRPAKMVERIATAVADGDPRLLCALVDLLDELFAAVLGQLRQHEPDDLAVVGRVNTEIGLLDR